jgi:hypothetical protein
MKLDCIVPSWRFRTMCFTLTNCLLLFPSRTFATVTGFSKKRLMNYSSCRAIPFHVLRKSTSPGPRFSSKYIQYDAIHCATACSSSGVFETGWNWFCLRLCPDGRFKVFRRILYLTDRASSQEFVTGKEAPPCSENNHIHISMTRNSFLTFAQRL